MLNTNYLCYTINTFNHIYLKISHFKKFCLHKYKLGINLIVINNHKKKKKFNIIYYYDVTIKDEFISNALITGY